jgi:MFS family permease
VRRLLPIYALIFVAEVLLQAFVPLTPTFTDRFSLTKVEAGALLAAASLSSVVVSIPIGLLADRIGARRVTVAATVLLAVSAIGQGLAGGFWLLFVSRATFGVAFGMIWTAGLAWLSDATPARQRAGALAACMTVAGAGAVAGPTFAGVLADHFGVATPFVIAALAAVAIGTVLLRIEPGQAAEHERTDLLAAARAARHDRWILGGVSIMAFAGIVASAVNLLVPLRLGENGLSASSIGLAFSAAACVFTILSAGLARLGSRAVSAKAAGAAVLFLGGALVLPIVSSSTPALVGFILLRTPAFAVLFTIVYPLGAAGAHRAGIGRGAVMAFLNVAWGVATLVGPLAGGALAQTFGERFTYALLAGSCLVAGVFILGALARRAAPEKAPAPSAPG